MAKVKKYTCPHDGQVYNLPPNLFLNQHKKEGKWRYKHPTSGMKKIETFLDVDSISYLPTKEAIKYANALNEKHYSISIDSPAKTISRDSLSAHIERHISQRNKKFPSKINTENWKASCSRLRRFCAEFNGTPTNKITLLALEEVFYSFTDSNQRSIRCALAKFFNYLIKYELVPQFQGNPFVPSSVNEIEFGEAKDKLRRRMDIEDYAAILKSAEEDKCTWFVAAIKLSFLLALRRADIVKLSFDNYNREEGYITHLIEKSKNQKGRDKAVTLKFTRQTHPEAMTIIEQAYQQRHVTLYKTKKSHGRIISSEAIEESPYVIHTRPQIMKADLPKTKTHFSQVTPDHFSKTFAKYREMNPEIEACAINEGLDPATLHEIRSLNVRLQRSKGVNVSELKDVLGQSGEAVCEEYYLDGNTIIPHSVVTLSDVTSKQLMH